MVVISLCISELRNLPGLPCASVLSIAGSGVQFASSDIIMIPWVLVLLHSDSNDFNILTFYNSFPYHFFYYIQMRTLKVNVIGGG